MARDATVKTVLTASDQASGPLRNFQNTIRGVKTEMGDMNDVAGMLKGGIASIAAAAGVDALMQLGQGAMELGRAGEQASILRDAFDQTAAGVGAASASMLSSLQAASGGMIADTDLMLAANRAMMLGVADSAAEMGQLLEVAAVRGRAMGLSTSQAFNDLVTGLGRMSPLILDNLGIVTGGEAVFTAYAASIGKTADALTDAERKQALFNKVVASTDTSGELVVSQFERMDAAIQNAKTAMGELFGPAVAAIAQQLADSVNAVFEVRENPALQMELANLRKNLQDATTEWLNLKRAQEEAANLPFIKSGNIGFAEGREEWDGPSPVPAPDTSKLDAAKKKMDELGQAVQDLEDKMKLYAGGMDELDPKLDRIREKQAEAAATARTFAEIERLVAESAGIMAGALDRAGGAVDSIRGKLIQAAAAGMSASQALATFDAAKDLEDQANQIRQGLGNLGFYEPENIEFYIDVNTARAQKGVDDLIGGFNEVENTIKSITNLTPGLLNNMSFDEALEWQAEQEASLRAQAESLRDQGYSNEQIAQYLRANVMETQAWASGLDKVSSATSDIEKSISSLQGRVQGALSEAITLDVTWPGKDGADDGRDINENARRMAAIANEGLIGQDWLGDLANEAPGAYADLMLKIAAGADAKSAAQSIMADFQAGLRPDMLNLDALKEDIKNQIAGETAMAATAAQITAELVADTGGDSADIQAKVNKALGLGVKSTELTDGIVGQLNSSTFNSQLNTAASGGGKAWGNTFLATVEQNVPPALVALLVNLVTPGVQSNIATQDSLTGPTE
jgi:hypothetical protein